MTVMISGARLTFSIRAAIAAPRSPPPPSSASSAP
jgi:hypothetical protein